MDDRHDAYVNDDKLVALAELLPPSPDEGIFDEEEACAEDICERDTGYCKWCGRCAE